MPLKLYAFKPDSPSKLYTPLKLYTPFKLNTPFELIAL